MSAPISTRTDGTFTIHTFANTGDRDAWLATNTAGRIFADDDGTVPGAYLLPDGRELYVMLEDVTISAPDEARAADYRRRTAYVPGCDFCDRAAVARIPDDMTDDTADVCPDHLRGVSIDDVVAVWTGVIWTDNLAGRFTDCPTHGRVFSTDDSPHAHP